MKQTTPNAMRIRAKINNYAKDSQFNDTVSAVKALLPPR